MRIYYELQQNIIDTLKSNLKFEIEQSPSKKGEIIEDFLNNIDIHTEEQTDYEIGNACIYNYRCFDIVKEIGMTHWEEEAEFWGMKPNSIYDLAVLALSTQMYGAFFKEDIENALVTYCNTLK